MFNHFGKVLKVFRNILRFGNFYFDHVTRWGKLGLQEFCYKLRCARISNGPQIKTKMEITLQEDGGIHRKQHKEHFLRACFRGFSVRRKDLLFFEYISQEAFFAFLCSKMGLGFAMCDGGTIYFYFFSVQVFSSLAGKLRLTTSVPVSASFIELDATTALHLVVVAIISLSRSETTTIFVSLRETLKIQSQSSIKAF